VIQTTKTREVFTLDCHGNRLCCTYHIPAQGSLGSNRLGILLLSGFPMPRAAHGDAAVYWAISLAELSYPSFRVDLPGIGDSTGEVPTELLAYTTAGGYEQVAAELVDQIAARYELAGVVMLGQCGGGISAIFAAAISDKCRGLILLDPPFNVPPVARPSVKRALFHWSTKSRIGGLLSNGYDQLKKLSLKLRKNAPPKNANFALLKRWKNVAGAGMPILLLNAPEPKATDKQPRAGKFDYRKHILDVAGKGSRVDARIIAGANHAFSNPSGKAAVREHAAEWLTKVFPSERSAMQAFMEKRRPTDETELSLQEEMPTPVEAVLEVKG
jgi:pimeloyl-ACP methyl ester carboxylesterase